MGEYGRSDRVASDDILDDELSDDLSDNALENSSASISNITGPHYHKAPVQNTVSFCTKTDVNSRHKDSKNAKQLTTQTPNRKPCVETQQNTSSTSASSRSTGVTLGGQRIRIFNEPRPPPSPEEDNININSDASTGLEFTEHNGISADNDENNDFDVRTSQQQERSPRNAATSSSLIPRLTSPRRPPRKTKTSSEPSNGCSNSDILIHEDEEDENENESAATNSTETGGASVSQAKDGRSSTAAEGGCIIKSILKKPSSVLPGEISTSLRTFSDTISKPDFTVCAAAVNSASSGQKRSPSPAAPSSGSGDFYLPTFQEYKQQHRKKKQVQFKVANDVAVLEPVQEDHKLDSPVTTTGTATSVTDSLAATTVITSHVSPVAEDEVALNNRLLSVKIDKWIRCDKGETEHVKQERRNEEVAFINEEENLLDFKNEESTISSDVRGKDKAPICDKDELKSLVNDNVKSGVTKERDDVESDESVKLQYFGVGGVEVVNSGNVSGGETASRNGAEGAKDAADDRNSPDVTPAVSGGNGDSIATTSGEYLRLYYVHPSSSTSLSRDRSMVSSKLSFSVFGERDCPGKVIMW
jgi:hypothetical protein